MTATTEPEFGTLSPTMSPSALPTISPFTLAPSNIPTAMPSTSPSMLPSFFPTQDPTTPGPSYFPSAHPTSSPMETLTPEIKHEGSAVNLAMMVCILLLCIFAGYILKRKKFHYLPESGASMLIGLIVGSIATSVREPAQMREFVFDPDVFFFVLLPPIIFEAGFTLKKLRFFSNLGSILLFAVLGTVLSTFVIGMCTYAAASAGLINITSASPLMSLLFGALISAVDPVATLAIIGNPEMHCDPLLYSLVFGESVLNDAVAIVLFRVFNEYQDKTGPFTAFDALEVLVNFSAISFGSVAIGVGFGLVCSLLFRWSFIRNYHTFEIQLIFATAFGCFAVAEVVMLSGVMALFFCGVTLSHYNFHNMSQQTKISSIYVLEALASASETVVFAYMGMGLAVTHNLWDFRFVGLAILLCFLGRIVNIFPLSFLANFMRTNKIPFKMQCVMVFAGLRGAVAYALSQQLIPTKDGRDNSVQIIQSTTLAVIIFTTFFLGGTTSPLLSVMDMKASEKRGSDADDNGEVEDLQLREDFSRYISLPNSVSDPYLQHDEEEEHEHEQHIGNVRESDSVQLGNQARNSLSRRSTGDISRGPALRRHRASSADELDSGLGLGPGFTDENGLQDPGLWRRADGAHRFWTRFDANIMQPIFGGSVAPSVMTVEMAESEEPTPASSSNHHETGLLDRDLLGGDGHRMGRSEERVAFERDISPMNIDVVPTHFRKHLGHGRAGQKASRSANNSPNGFELRNMGAGGGADSVSESDVAGNSTARFGPSAYEFSPPRAARSLDALDEA